MPGERSITQPHLDAEPSEDSTTELRRINAALRAEIAAHAASRAALDEQGEILDAFFRHTQTCLVLLDREFNFIRVNDAYANACRRDASSFAGRNHFELYPSPIIEDFKRVVAEKTRWSIAARPFVFPDHPEWGTTYWDLALIPILDHASEVSHLVFSLHDVTPTLRAEAALRETEERYRQAQKMESIGRLAGGVAHDFNNLLTIINAYTAQAINSLPVGNPTRGDLTEVLKAATSAAALTRQLLAFSRQQVLQPRPVSLNQIVSSIENMLRRLLGEDVVLRFSPGAIQPLVLVDPGQIEQVVMNLAVNARDAMPNGGTVAVETGNVTLDERRGQELGLPPGDYVRLSVSDTGEGMDEATQARVFEPFFTTKEQGKGTGLGLSTVHGIIAQSDGQVVVRSEPGKGTTFLVYLPLNRDVSTEAPLPPAPRLARTGGHELVLLVEDDDAVRHVVQHILESEGYVVLTAASGAEALALSEREPRTIRLLLTDVVLPQMSGMELSNRLTPARPALETVYMSGYAAGAFGGRFELPVGSHFVAKPIESASLIQALRRALAPG